MDVPQNNIAFAVQTTRYYIAAGKYGNLVAQTIAEAVTVSFGFIYIRPFKMLCHTKEDSVFKAEIKLAAVAGFHFIKLGINCISQVKVKT